MYQSEINYLENQMFVSDYKPTLKIVQINDANTYKNTAIRVFIGEQENWFSPQELDNWIWDYGYTEITK
jgi:hypothetical protein